ncbi:MAG TPA: hypothetical protein DEF51_29090, partial [Myxococcales bacterium]|nr:hypothetical protein [Myxococcales bacterium]
MRSPGRSSAHNGRSRACSSCPHRSPPPTPRPGPSTTARRRSRAGRPGVSRRRRRRSRRAGCTPRRLESADTAFRRCSRCRRSSPGCRHRSPGRRWHTRGLADRTGPRLRCRNEGRRSCRPRRTPGRSDSPHRGNAARARSAANIGRTRRSAPDIRRARGRAGRSLRLARKRSPRRGAATPSRRPSGRRCRRQCRVVGRRPPHRRARRRSRRPPPARSGSACRGQREEAQEEKASGHAELAPVRPGSAEMTISHDCRGTSIGPRGSAFRRRPSNTARRRTTRAPQETQRASGSGDSPRGTPSDCALPAAEARPRPPLGLVVVREDPVGERRPREEVQTGGHGADHGSVKSRSLADEGGHLEVTGARAQHLRQPAASVGLRGRRPLGDHAEQDALTVSRVGARLARELPQPVRGAHRGDTAPDVQDGAANASERVIGRSFHDFESVRHGQDIYPFRPSVSAAALERSTTTIAQRTLHCAPKCGHCGRPGRGLACAPSARGRQRGAELVASRRTMSIEQERVAVIGAGVSGIAAANVWQRCGYDVTVYEASDRVGGQWAKSYAGVRLQNTAPQYQFADFPWPFEPDRHPTGEQVLRYLEAAVEAFELDVRLGQRVTELSRTSDGWSLTVDGETERVAYVVVATGQYPGDAKHVPAFEGLERFEGEVVTRIDSHSVFEGKRVAVIGFGKTALDFASWSAEIAERTVHVFRTPRWTIPDTLLGVDYTRPFFARFGSDMMPSWEYSSPPQRFLHTHLSPVVRGFWHFIATLFLFQHRRDAKLGAMEEHGDARRLDAVMPPKSQFLADLRSASAVAPGSYYRQVA